MTTHSAAVVDEARQVPALGGVDDGVVVHPEQVAAADALLSVPLLSMVSHHLKMGDGKPLFHLPATSVSGVLSADDEDAPVGCSDRRTR